MRSVGSLTAGRGAGGGNPSRTNGAVAGRRCCGCCCGCGERLRAPFAARASSVHASSRSALEELTSALLEMDARAAHEQKVYIRHHQIGTLHQHGQLRSSAMSL